jgi:hypothetical protein
LKKKFFLNKRFFLNIKLILINFYNLDNVF